MKHVINRACKARNYSVTYGGKCLVEIANGRRPPDIICIENMNPGQLQTEVSRDERLDKTLQELAMKAHIGARQREDLRRDLAARLQPLHGPFHPGQGLGS